MAQTSAKAAKPNAWQRFMRYLQDVRSEYKRVVWPTRNEVINSSWIVATTLLIFIVLIFVLDQLSAFLTTALARVGG